MCSSSFVWKQGDLDISMNIELQNTRQNIFNCYPFREYTPWKQGPLAELQNERQHAPHHSHVPVCALSQVGAQDTRETQ